MTRGYSYPLSVTFKNNGSATWPAGGEWRLGSQNARDNETWGFNRVQMPSAVAPGGQVTFTFNVTAPSTSGSYNFQWRMVHDGVVWFGDTTPNVVVTVGAPSTLQGASFENPAVSGYQYNPTGTGWTFSCPATIINPLNDNYNYPLVAA
jgi:uncharacterized protein affecting Mg2+/Co2+ transport